jgi:hypothetical protein
MRVMEAGTRAAYGERPRVRPRGRPFTLFSGLSAATCALALSSSSHPARAEASPQTQEAASSDLDTESASHRTRFGATAGIGFPRPLSLEAMVKVGGFLGVGVEYGLLPSVTIDNVDTHLWSVAADARVFPFRNAFYLGLRAGRQHVEAATTVTIGSVATADEVLALDSWFLNPRIGVLWTASIGLTVGMEVGVQIPLSPGVSSSLPLALVPEAERTVNTLGKTVLPTIELLQIGMLF